MVDRFVSLASALQEFAARVETEGSPERVRDAIAVRAAAADLQVAFVRPVDVRTTGHADLSAHHALEHIEELCLVLRRRITAARSRAGYNDLLRSDELHAAEVARVMKDAPK